MKSPWIFIPENFRYRLSKICPICENGRLDGWTLGTMCRLVTYNCGHQWVQIGIGDGNLNTDGNGYFINKPPTIVDFWFLHLVEPLGIDISGVPLQRYQVDPKNHKALEDAKVFLDAIKGSVRLNRVNRAAFVETYAAKGLVGLIDLIDQLIPTGLSGLLDNLHYKIVVAMLAALPMPGDEKVRFRLEQEVQKAVRSLFSRG